VAVIVVGALLVMGVAAITLGQSNQSGASQSSPTRFETSFTPEVTGAPRVMVPQEYIDYGDVKLGRTIKTVFEARSVGDQPLTILGEPQVELVEGC
jgi:hypothetical protein